MSDEKRPETLTGGPFDGLDLDVRPSDDIVIPMLHHRREYGIAQAVAYVRRGQRLVYDASKTEDVRTWRE